MVFRRTSPTYRPAPRRAGLIRLLAGLPAGAFSPRRGSTLVLIVGALAVLSVIVVGYWAIGRGDRQTGGAVVRADQVQERIDGIRDYFRAVVGRDVLSVYSEGDGLVSGEALILGEQTDFPFTDWDRRSEIDSGWSVEEQDRRRFDPAGTLAPSWQPDGRLILSFPPSDPWLASTHPSWVNFTSLATPEDRINERRDWWQISNFAPDGRFVNLWNLAPVVNNARVANFDAESGFGNDARNFPRISANLYRLDDEGNATQDLDFPLSGGLDIETAPAVWTMRQIRAFRPAMEVQYQADDPRNAHYMWADADGDGMFDARWFELVDAAAFDPANTSRRLVTPLLPHDGRYRWFAAARAIDLSSLVNVNTASFVSPPDTGTNPPTVSDPRDHHRIGVTPTDVDIRRLFTLEDGYLDLELDGYADLPGPASAGAAENYSNYDFLGDGFRVGHLAFTGLTFAQRQMRAPEPGWASAFTALEGAERVEHFRSLLTRPESGAFGLDDLVELLTYHGVNDPAATSRLEQAVGGRDTGSFTRFSPLRDNRSLEWERDYLFDMEVAPQVDSSGQLNRRSGSPGPWPHGVAGITHASADVRRSLTTLSGARPLRSARLPYQGDLEDASRFTKIGDPRRRQDSGRTQWNVLAEMIGDLNFRRPQERLLADFDGALFNPVGSPTSAWHVWKPDPVNTGQLMRSSPPALPTSAARISARDALTLRVNCVDPTVDPPTEVATPVDSCQLLFAGYIDALLPCSGDEAAWEIGSAEYDRMRTAFYGDDPRAAVKAAAHLAVNARDMFDEGNDPGAYTLVLGRPVSRSGAPPELVVNHENSTLTLPSGRAVPDYVFPAPGDPVDPSDPNYIPRTLDIYGVEAQPFLTEVASYIIYTDHHFVPGNQGMGADNDGTVVNPPNPPTQGPITIDGDVDQANKDLMVQVVAFQIHNPYDTDIELSDYEVHFGGNQYPLDKIAPDGGGSERTLKAGESRTVFATYPSVYGANGAESLTVVNDRLTAAMGPPCTPAPTGDFFGPWLTEQLGPVGTGDLDRSVVEPADLTSTDLLYGDPGETDSDENRVAILVRSVDRSVGGPIDVVVDRLRDPSPFNDPVHATKRATLDVRLSRGRNDIGSANLDEQCQGDNRGLSITFWGSIRRPDFDSSAGDLLPRGALPPWCLERRDHAPNSSTGDEKLRSLNLSTPDDRNTDNRRGTPQRAWFDRDALRATPPCRNNPGGPHSIRGADGKDTLASLLSDQNGLKLNGTINEAPKDKWMRESNGGLCTEIGLQRLDHLPRNESEGRRPGRDARALFSQLLTEVRLDNEEFMRVADPLYPDTKASVLRPADLLCALAIGGEHDPAIEDNPETVGHDGWLTLSEAMAQALGYDDGVPTPSERPTDLYEITDRGYLRLDDFAPFVNHDTDPLRVFTPGQDERRNSGIPLALNVLDIFTTHFDGEPETIANPASSLVTRLDGSSALSTPVPGLINICTAPLPVLRTLPMLSPPPDEYPDPGVYPPGLWWWPELTDPLLQHTFASDIASSVLAYRDRIALGPRAAGGNVVDYVDPVTGTPAFSGDPSVSSFDFYSEPWLGRSAGVEPNPTLTLPPSPTEINGLREQPGFAGVGELLAVRNLRYGGSTNLTLMDVDRLAADGVSLDRRDAGGVVIAGIDSFLHEDPVTGEDVHDELADDYDEKLAIANAAAASSSVRSDYFAVWFVVHGYQRTDVEGLRRSDMIRPSIARRFLMILDRSNVVREGDLPRMLVFKELPM